MVCVKATGIEGKKSERSTWRCLPNHKTILCIEGELKAGWNWSSCIEVGVKVGSALCRDKLSLCRT